MKKLTLIVALATLCLSSVRADDSVDAIAATLFENGLARTMTMCRSEDFTCRAEKMKSVAKIMSEKAWAYGPPTSSGCVNTQLALLCKPNFHVTTPPGVDARGCPHADVCVADKPAGACPPGKHSESHPCTHGDCSGVPDSFCVDNVPGKDCPVVDIRQCYEGGTPTYDANGCQTGITCNGEVGTPNCPVVDIPQCYEGGTITYDAKGCQIGIQCNGGGGTPPTNCPLYQTPLCTGNRSLQEREADANGCPQSPICVDTPDSGGFTNGPTKACAQPPAAISCDKGGRWGLRAEGICGCVY